jgi:hypothetical protein
MLIGCAVSGPGEKARWDDHIRKLCERDGRVTILEQVTISKSDLERGVLPRSNDGRIDVELRQLAHPEAPVYAERNTTYFREWNPQVGRVEWTVIRRQDGAVVARWVRYGRFGGDLSTGLAHDSSFSCPDPQTINEELQKLFVVEGGK